jgi:CheY-like chemotaxis protein
MLQEAPAILVLDDDEDVRDTIGSVLKAAGFRVTTVATGLEAIALVDETPFDLLVADVRLPGGLSGLQTTQLMRVRHPEIKCLFISGNGDPKVCDPRLDDFVSKPFRAFELLGCVWKVLRGNQPYPRLDVAPRGSGMG